MIDLKQALLPNFWLFKVFKRSSLEYFILFKGIEGDVLCEVVEVAHVAVGEVHMVGFHENTDVTIGKLGCRLNWTSLSCHQVISAWGLNEEHLFIIFEALVEILWWKCFQFNQLFAVHLGSIPSKQFTAKKILSNSNYLSFLMYSSFHEMLISSRSLMMNKRITKDVRGAPTFLEHILDNMSYV